MLNQAKAAVGAARDKAIAWIRHPTAPRSRAGVLITSAVIVAVLGGGSGLYLMHQRSLPDGAAFAIGDRIVTVDEFNAEVDKLRALYGVKRPDNQPDKMADFRRKSAKAIAVSMILEQQARQMGIQVPDKRVHDVLDSYIANGFGPGPDGRDQFIRVLGNVGTTEGAVLDAIHRQLAVNSLFGKVTADVAVDNKDLREAFPKYDDSLGTPERRRISNIVVRSKQQARQILTRVRAGADFAKLARRTSLDGATRNDGGDLGVVTAEQLQDSYGKVAFSTPSGHLFGPVHNKFGWNVGRVMETIPARPAAYEEVKDRLKTLVEFDQKTDRWQSWLKDTIKEADVRYADRYRPAKPYAPPAGEPRAPGRTPTNDGPAASREPPR